MGASPSMGRSRLCSGVWSGRGGTYCVGTRRQVHQVVRVPDVGMQVPDSIIDIDPWLCKYHSMRLARYESCFARSRLSKSSRDAGMRVPATLNLWEGLGRDTHPDRLRRASSRRAQGGPHLPLCQFTSRARLSCPMPALSNRRGAMTLRRRSGLVLSRGPSAEGPFFILFFSFLLSTFSKVPPPQTLQVQASSLAFVSSNRHSEGPDLCPTSLPSCHLDSLGSGWRFEGVLSRAGTWTYLAGEWMAALKWTDLCSKADVYTV